MSARDVDEYLRIIEEPKRSTLEALRRRILEIVPDAGTSHLVQGRGLSRPGPDRCRLRSLQGPPQLPPLQRSVLPQLASELEGYTMTKSALHFPIDRPLSKTLVKKLIALRLEN